MFLSLVAIAGALRKPASAQRAYSAVQQRSAARRFLEHRSVGASGRRPFEGRASALVRAKASRRSPPAMRSQSSRAQQPASARAQSQLPVNLATTWFPAGPQQTLTAAYGPVTGRVTSIAVDPADGSGNTVYAGTTGGGVWKSTNAAGPAGQVSFVPVTDDVSTANGSIASLASFPSLSIGAVSVQPGGTGVVLAGTGDPNDALDSYYGSGILRSTDNGGTWTTITDANLGVYPGSSFSFYGNGFAGFAWSTAKPGLVVAAVTEAYDGLVVDAQQVNSVEGIYYSLDAGATWLMATLTDGPNSVFESNTTTTTSIQGNAVTSVVWNPFRQAFFAAIRYHGYYTSPDGATWTRLPDASQPGADLATSLCPDYAPGAISCPIFRGALAVQPATGDMFAFTVDGNLVDQGIWQDVCAANRDNSCSTQVTFGNQIPDTALQDGSGHILQGDYDLWLAAVPANADTLLYAGTVDIWKRSLAASNVPWRNTTSSTGCAAAQVAPSQHAVAVAGGASMFFGNDGGLWRTTDGIGEAQPACSSDDATHFDNLNPGLGSLAEITSLAQAPGSDTTLLVGLGVNGTAGTTVAQGAWPQVLDGLGGYTAIDPVTMANWYMTSGPGVSISSCDGGGACRPASFQITPTVGDSQTGGAGQGPGDGESLPEPAVWMLDPQDTSKMIVGTCRVWRGGVTGAGWSAIGPVLGDSSEPDCTLGEGQIQSLGASGTAAGSAAGEEILYAGMEGYVTGGYQIPYGGLVAGHVFTAAVGKGQSGPAAWTDVTSSGNVVNDQSNRGQFNPGGFGVSSVVVDPHDPSGHTVYATIQGFGEPVVYQSTDQGQHWTNMTANLPAVPVNALVVDPGDANIVYVATDVGVYATSDTSPVSSCGTGQEICWSAYGNGLPNVPVTTLTTNGAANDYLLMAGTYGRGAWQMQLASACDAITNASPPQLSYASGLSFGNVAVGTAVSMELTITNNGASTCITSVQASGGFTSGNACAGVVLANGDVCTLQVQFAPSAAGPYNGALTLITNAQGSSFTVGLTGTGIPSPILLSPTGALAFGATQINSAAAEQFITVTDVSSQPVTFLSTSTAPAPDYAMQSSSNCTGTLQPNGNCTIGIVFTPSAGGPDDGVLTLATDHGTFTAQLTGTGLTAAADSLSATSLSFGDQTVGTASAVKTVSLVDSGGEPLTLVTASSSTSEYAVNASACATVAAGGQCSIEVSFAPAAPGQRNGTLTVADSLHSGASALTVALTGVGVAPAGVASIASVPSFGAEGVGSTSAPQTVTLTNNGSVAISGLSFAASGDFAAAAGTCGTSLAAGTSCAVSVTFTPSTTGQRTGTLTAYGSNLTPPLTAALTGTGLNFTIGAVATGTGANGTTDTEVTGTTANYVVSIAPVGGSAGNLTISCALPSTMPAGSACTLNPATSVQLTAGTTQTVGVAVTTPALTVSRAMPFDDRQRLTWLLAFALPCFGWCRRRSIWTALCMLLLAGVLFCSALAGCGANSSGGSSTTTTTTGTTGSGVPPASYSIIVTASAPGIEQTAQMTLLLEQ